MSRRDNALLKSFERAHAVVGSPTVEYVRGETVLVAELAAIPGALSAKVVDAALGLATEADCHQFLIRSADLVAGEDKTDPARGDRIRWTHDDVVEEFVVNHPDPNAPHFRRRDPRGLLLRVYSLKNDQEAAPEA